MSPKYTRRDILRAGVLAGFGGAALTATALAVRERSAPYRNVVLLTCDCLRADRLGCYGYKKTIGGAPRSTTPNLDALSEEGVLFERHYSQSNLTMTSLVSLLNSANPVTGGGQDYEFLRGRRNIIYELRSFLCEGRSYYSEAVLSNVLLLDEVFTQNFECIQNATTVRRFADKMEELNERLIFPRAEAIRDRFEAILDNRAHREQNLLVWAHFMDVHEPYSPPSRFLSQLTSANPEDCFAELKQACISGAQVQGKDGKVRDVNDLYDASVMYLDEQLGLALQSMKDRRLLDDTLVIIAADHGQSLGEHGAVGHGITLYEPEVHVPLLVLGAGIPKGARVRTRTRNIDVIPTISEYLGKTNTSSFDGESLFPLIQSAASNGMTSHREVFACADFSVFGLSDRKREMLVSPSGHAYIETDDTKGNLLEAELYDMNSDPGQAGNIIASQGELAARLAARLKEMHAPGAGGAPTGTGASKPAIRSREMDEQLRALGYISG